MATTGTPPSLPHKQATLVADGGRFQEVWDVAVVDCRIELDRFTDGTEAGTQDDAATRRFAPATANVGGGFGDLGSQMLH